MAKIRWHEGGQRFYNTGVDRGVLYPAVGPGVPWNGLVSVVEEVDALERLTYFDGIKTAQRHRDTDFKASVEAYDVPLDLDGSIFAFTYRTFVAEDLYMIHLVYNARFVREQSRVNSLGEGDPALYSWGLYTSPVHLTGPSYGAHVIVRSDAALLSKVEAVLYGNDDHDSRLPSPAELIELLESEAVLRIVDHGDGTYSAIGPDDVVIDHGDGSFTINYPSVVFLDEDTFRVSSL